MEACKILGAIELSGYALSSYGREIDNSLCGWEDWYEKNHKDRRAFVEWYTNQYRCPPWGSHADQAQKLSAELDAEFNRDKEYELLAA